MVRKTVVWRGDSKEVAHEWPKKVRLKLGQELTRVELGDKPRSGEALPDVGKGVQAIRLDGDKRTYRVVYVASIGNSIYVLHSFLKKSTKGIETPQHEKELARDRYNALCRELGSTHKAPRRNQ
jgi:phage-related protein